MQALSVENVSKNIKGNMLVDSCSFAVEEGEVVSLIGPNGAGKSTIMKMLAHLVFPTDGKIFVCGKNLAADTETALSCLSAAIEAPALYPQLTGRQHLEMIALLRGKSRGDVERYADLSGLGAKLEQRVTKYSLGMKQRLYLYMALLAEPKLLILDEPTNGLDFSGVVEFCEQIRALAGRGTGVLLSSHILSDLSKVSDKFVFIDRGKILRIVQNDSEADVENLYMNCFGAVQAGSGLR